MQKVIKQNKTENKNGQNSKNKSIGILNFNKLTGNERCLLDETNNSVDTNQIDSYIEIDKKNIRNNLVKKDKYIKKPIPFYESLHSLFPHDLQSLKLVFESLLNKSTRNRIGKIIIKNKSGIINQFENANDYEVQIFILKIINKSLTPNEIKSLNSNLNIKKDDKKSVFSALNNTNEILKFILSYNIRNNNNQKKIFGSHINTFECKQNGISLIGGYMFIARDSIKIYSGSDTLILLNKNIIKITISDKIRIIAKGESDGVENKDIMITGNLFNINYKTLINELERKYVKKEQISQIVRKININKKEELSPVGNLPDMDKKSQGSISEDKPDEKDKVFLLNDETLSLSVNSAEIRIIGDSSGLSVSDSKNDTFINTEINEDERNLIEKNKCPNTVKNDIFIFDSEDLGLSTTMESIKNEISSMHSYSSLKLGKPIREEILFKKNRPIRNVKKPKKKSKIFRKLKNYKPPKRNAKRVIQRKEIFSKKLKCKASSLYKKSLILLKREYRNNKRLIHNKNRDMKKFLKMKTVYMK